MYDFNYFTPFFLLNLKNFNFIAGFKARYKLNNYEIMRKLLLLDQKYYCTQYSCPVDLTKDNLGAS